VITARTLSAAAPFVASLAAKAGGIAKAHAAARRDRDRWRKPALLWPLF
jgi:hypothetical protein